MRYNAMKMNAALELHGGRESPKWDVELAAVGGEAPTRGHPLSLIQRPSPVRAIPPVPVPNVSTFYDASLLRIYVSIALHFQ